MKKFIYLGITIILQTGLCIQVVNAQSWPGCSYNWSATTSEFHVCYTDPWALVFVDEFNGDALDLSVWDPKTGLQRAGEAEYSKPENVVVSNGTLKIITKREIPAIIGPGAYPNQTLQNFDYSSGEIWSKYKFGHGKYEARIKIPGGLGLWPAFWMYGANGDGGEIDVFEFSAKTSDDPNSYTPSAVDMTAHYQGNFCQTTYSSNSFASDYFIYTVIYEKDEIKWYINGSLISTQYVYTNITGNSMGCNMVKDIPVPGGVFKNKSFPFEPSFNIILNTAVKLGNRGPNGNTPFPAQMEIDWITFSERKPCAGNITINDQTQLVYNFNYYNIQTFNSLIGSSITIAPSDTIKIPSQKQYKMIAQNRIDLKPGFRVIAGADFNAKIDPVLCTGVYRMASENSDETIDYSPNNQSKITSDKILIYPNPSNNTFTLSLDFTEENNTIFNIYNSIGKLVYSSSLGALKSTEKLIDIDLEEGLYLIKINHGEKEFTEKLIVKK